MDLEVELMKIEVIDGLLLASIVVEYQGKTKTVDRVVIDTGASHTILSSDAVDDLGISFKTGDVIIESHGIGGSDYAFQKKIESIHFAGYTSYDCYVDFGQLNWGNLNGLIGLDILLAGSFTIDLDFMELHPKRLEE